MERNLLALIMVSQTKWLNREFVFNLPTGVFPPLLERLRGTPVRAKELVRGVSEEVLATRLNGGWCAKEHIGHLIDLHPLDEKRLTEFLSSAAILSAADPENRATEIANHRNGRAAAIVDKLASDREQLISQLEMLTEAEVQRTAIHPRLQQPMRLLDWIYFLAEHDDHHLALARSAISMAARRTSEF